MCDLGFFFDDGLNCVEPSANNRSETGCLFTDINDPANCYLCDTNYYMNSSFQCIAESVSTQETGETEEGLRIMEILELLGLLLLLF